MRRLVWFRGKDLRLADHAPLSAALEGGEALLLFVLDSHFFAPERAQRLPRRMAFLLESLAELRAEVDRRGGHLLLLAGRSVDLVPRVAARAGVAEVLVQRWSEPFARQRDERIARALADQGIGFRAFEGETLLQPGSVRTGSGGAFRVFTPFARAARSRLLVQAPLPMPQRLPPLPSDLDLGMAEAPLPDAAGLGIPPSMLPGGASRAQQRMGDFLAAGLQDYSRRRDLLAEAGTSRLSADLHFGTLSVRQVWSALADRPDEDAERFRQQLLWRDFAHHLLWEWPELLEQPFRPEFRGFPWREDGNGLEAWKSGRTGFPVVDAAARQLQEEGFVHNRARMLAASFLAKHLMVDYRLGEAHYLEHLMDGDWANNNLGWQWSAGCGCDAQPWFRIFNPIAQGERFDPMGAYVRHWLPELREVPDRWIHQPWASGLPVDYPEPILDLAVGRARFLATARQHLGARLD